MKKLIYLPFVLIALLAASCQKDDSVKKTGSGAQSQDSLATVSLVNNSNTAYEVAFSKTGYTVDIPKNSRLSISLKAGAYNISVYPSGSQDYASHSISWDDLAPVYAPRANFNNVQVNATSPQSLLIY